MNKIELSNMYGYKKESEILHVLRQELHKRICGCIECIFNKSYRDIVVYIHYDRFSYEIIVPLKEFVCINTYDIKIITEYVCKKYHDMIVNERFSM